MLLIRFFKHYFEIFDTNEVGLVLTHLAPHEIKISLVIHPDEEKRWSDTYIVRMTRPYANLVPDVGKIKTSL